MPFLHSVFHFITTILMVFVFLSDVYICFDMPCIFCGWISILVLIFIQGFPLILLLAHILYIQVLWCWLSSRIWHVKILNFIDSTTNSEICASIQEILCEAIKSQARYEIRIVEKISTFTNMFHLNFAWSYMWHFQQHLTSCTTEDTTVIFLKTWEPQFVAID